MSVLVVVSHPDDEVLGCGATMATLAAQGIPVKCCILCGDALARTHRSEQLREDTARAQTILGLPEPSFGPFPNIQFNTVPHLHLVQFIEENLRAFQADTIITHHPRDLNDDHRHTALACQAAARYFQRAPGSVPHLRALLFMEILSSTDWAFPQPGGEFLPTSFFSVDKQAMNKKIEALKAYTGVMRPFPHSRSEEAIRALAQLRGAQCGTEAAEAFQVAFAGLEGLISPCTRNT